ncbi:MAG: DUF3526 domain-containing protein [Rubricoccaceae bacterium]
MNRAIASKELTEMFRSGRVWIGAGTALALLVVALAAGVAQVSRAAAERAAAASADRAAWIGQGEANPHSAAHYGMWAFAPAQPLAAFDPGVTPFTGTALFLEGHTMHTPRFRPAEDAPPGARLGTLSGALVLTVLVPLLLILLTFDTCAGERERGTLRTLLALGVRPRDVLAGKALAAAAPVALVLGAALVLAFGAVVLAGDVRAHLPRASLLVGAYALYLAGVLGLALGVSARARTARGALAGLVGAWAVAAVLVPRLAVTAAEVLVPTPSAAEIADARAADLAKLPDWAERRAEIEAELMQAHGVSRPEDLPVDPSGPTFEWFEAEETRVHRAHADALADRFERQQAIFAWAGVLSPVLPMRLVSAGLAGTDLAHARHFADAAEAYRFAYVQHLNRDLAENQGYGERRIVGTDFWADVPAFIYTLPPTGWALRQHSVSLALLALWAAAGLAFAVTGARRLHPD